MRPAKATVLDHVLELGVDRRAAEAIRQSILAHADTGVPVRPKIARQLLRRLGVFASSRARVTSNRRGSLLLADDVVGAASRSFDIPEFRPGDTVKVHVNVIDGNRSRIQVFLGVVVARADEGARETFTVRKVSFQVGVERTFAVHSPAIDRIEVVTRGDTRRAKLDYLREIHSRKARTKARRKD